MHNNTYDPSVYYYYSTPEQRWEGLKALRLSLIRSNHNIEEIEFTEIPNQNNNDKETKTPDL